MRITLVRTRSRPPVDINEELQWLGNTLGLFTERDKEKSCFRIFIQLLKASKHNQMVTSDELAYQLNLARGTVVYHLNKLIESKLVVPTNRAYALQNERLERVIENIEEDTLHLFSQLKALARMIDKKMAQEHKSPKV